MRSHPLRAASTTLIALLVACSPNDSGTLLAPIGRPAASVSPPGPQLVITEVMRDPTRVADTAGEWFEVSNTGSVAINLQGHRIVSAAGATGIESHTITATLVVAPGAYVVLGNNANPATNGGVPVAYSYGGAIALNNGSATSATEWLAIRTAAGVTLDSAAYAARPTPTSAPGPYMAPTGASRMVVDLGADNTIISGPNWVTATSVYGAGDRGTPGQANIDGPGPNRPPVAAIGGPYASPEGSPVALDASGSTDPDGDALTYAWDFGDGATGVGAMPTHAYADDGTYTIGVTVTDPSGATSTATTTVAVSNVAPIVTAFAGASLLVGETYSVSGTFVDPGADSWTGTVSYGDGTGPTALTLTGKTFALSHTYLTDGSITVTVGIGDDDGPAPTLQSATVIVIAPAQGAAALGEQVTDLVRLGRLGAAEGQSLKAKLEATERQLRRADTPAGVNLLNAFVNEIRALLQSGRIAPDAASELLAYANRVIASATR